MQTAGDGWEKEHNKGQLVKEVKRRWTVDSKSWNDFYTQSTSQVPQQWRHERARDGGDRQEWSKIQETWGSKKANGERNKSTHSWNEQKPNAGIEAKKAAGRPFYGPLPSLASFAIFLSHVAG